MNEHTHLTYFAELALDIVQANGGQITFDEYNKAMTDVKYFPPINWNVGWGLSPKCRKANNDKLCAFHAVKAGMLIQTDSGYSVHP